jgi:hypothetical protein
MPTYGPSLPTAATGNTNTIGGGTVAWTNTTNIERADGVFATCTPGLATTDDLRGGTFGFAVVSTDTVLGILLEVNVKCGTGGTGLVFTSVVLEGGGGASANRAAGTVVTTAATTFTFGGASDLWGTTWTPAQINAGAFVPNVAFGGAGSGPGILSVDFFRVTITTSSGSQSRMFQMF